MSSVARLNSHDSASDINIDVRTTAITCKITMREMMDLNRITLLLGYEVSDAAYCVDVYPCTFVGELLSQTMNINLDGIRGHVSRQPEDVILDLLLRNHTALASHQKLKHRGFPRRQDLRLIIDRRLPISKVK